jgi:hypothetical protein
MDLYEIVKKLSGPIFPVGESNEDESRFENLKAVTVLVDRLLQGIDRVSKGKNRNEYSIKKAGRFAASFLAEIGIYQNEE